MIYITIYLVALALVLIFNYCAAKVNKEAAARLGEDYYGE